MNELKTHISENGQEIDKDLKSDINHVMSENKIGTDSYLNGLYLNSDSNNESISNNNYNRPNFETEVLQARPDDNFSINNYSNCNNPLGHDGACSPSIAIKDERFDNGLEMNSCSNPLPLVLTTEIMALRNSISDDSVSNISTESSASGINKLENPTKELASEILLSDTSLELHQRNQEIIELRKIVEK